MKDLAGKAKMNKSSLPQKIGVKKTDIFDQKKIEIEFNQLFANAGPILAQQISESENTFEIYLVKTSAIMQHKSYISFIMYYVLLLCIIISLT